MSHRNLAKTLGLFLTKPNHTHRIHIHGQTPPRRGGGVAAVYRKDIKTTTIPIPAFDSFEHIAFKLFGPTPLVTAVIYPPPAKPNPSFFSDFHDFLYRLCSISTSVLLLGDFNFHVDDTQCKTAKEFLDLLHCLNFTQHVNFPTHSRGHILDLVCSTGLTIHQLSSLNLNISDHLAINMDILIPLPTPKQKRKISFRNIKSVDPSAFSASISSKISSSPPPQFNNPSELITYYNNTLSFCLDQLAPIKTKTVSFTHSAPWYTPELQKMKTRKRQLERLHKKTSLTVHFQSYSDYLKQYMEALSAARSPYYSHLIHSGSAIAPLITSIINSSLCSGSVPKTLKLAAVTPILKKPGLNTDSMCNFCPISNLPFLSKILERVVASQIKCHLSSNNLFEPFQSGFRSQHSTETALLKVTNDLLLSSDSDLLNILILLDLTAAFDTISHSILLSRLEHSLNITGTALSWLQSYLTDRQQFININNCSSSIAPLSQGVPQGSVLGPLLFIIYLLPLGNIIRQHGLHFHCYADDIQLYISTNSITTETRSTLTNCLNEIKTWMHTNFLSLNYAK
nr:uncharacterized protein LOC114921708 [Labrus bergylta]